MPTSSQALLLMHTGRSNLNLDRIPLVSKKSSIGSCSQRELKPCPVSHVDINELWKSSLVDSGEQLIVEDLTNLDKEQDSSVVSSEFNIKGYKTILSYNKSSESFSWKFNQPDQKESAETRESDTAILPNPPKTRPKTGVGTGRTRNRKQEDRSRPKTADVGSESKRQSVSFAKPLYYPCSNKGDKLLCLGLRMPVTKGTHGESTNCKSILKSTASDQGTGTNKSWVSSRSLESGGDGAISVKMKGRRGNSAKTSSMLKQLWIEHEKQKQKVPEEKCDDEKNENDAYSTSFANRVHPSIYMRKNPPDAGPFDVCFSLRHNDAVSHDELRNNIRKQTGVVPVGIRYEALSIRVGDYGIRNRWIVRTGSREDFNQLITTGLFIENDNIVVVPLEEVMEREFRTYRFLTETKAEHTAARIGHKLKNDIQMRMNKVK
ncbi:uncharacterized protein LOC117327542 [Pecten maximus]|uniref:uncharacterized protein LOC117327542 n=1 Tax=Pecten maximus TaxID=6579 RepID=UPI001458CC06|nr:uncharacterized protein LOC117327542 [Pecten maximus]